ncbi:ATP-binding protein [Fournierella massiliensis]|nr:ATP-binding protein [Fournierella massiliensis]MCF2556003.1 ATP-binding protein [Fournierella massiliensis]
MGQKIDNSIQLPSARDISAADKAARDILGRYSAKVFKSYLPRISKDYDVVKLGTGRSPEESVAFFDVTKLIIEEDGNLIEKLKNVYHLLAYSRNSIGLIIHRTHDTCRISLAVGMKNRDSEAVAKLGETIRDALMGNFPGSACSGIGYYGFNAGNPFASLNEETYFNSESIESFNSIAIASNIASEFSKDYIEQGLEKVLDGIIPAKKQEYTIILLAEAIDDELLEERRQSLYQTYTWLSPLSKRTENWSFQEGQNWGKNANANLIVVGAGSNSGGSTSSTQGASVEINQYAVSHTMEIIEKQMERIEHCAALGAYDFSAYVLSPNCQLASEVAHMYMSLTQGNESYYEKPSINVWNAQKDEKTREKISRMAEYLRRLTHPSFTSGKESASVKATATISGAELAHAMSLPRKSLPGFATIRCAAFGREITSYDSEYTGSVHLGCIHHMHRDEEKAVELNKNSFASHVFVTGSTGSGKSNAIYTLLDSLRTKFMVIEPAKGEYKYAFTKDVKVYGTNPQICELLRINPFVFNSGIHVYEHIDRLLDVFNVCWPMYAAMPAVLKDAIIKAYEDCGWNLITSQNSKGDIYPTFEDVCAEIDEIITHSDYSDENKGNYRGSLKTRLTSLTNGINRLIFCNGDISDENLFEQNVIIDLSRVGSAENKSLIMGMLIIRLQEYRMAEGCINSTLHHVTVLEEAHNILRHVPEGGGESGNLTQKSVEMISNAIAEMRTYGEGFVIADQAPGLLDMSVIRNTNTKIILRLPDKSDRELVGRAANLTDAQINELASLQRGVAAIYQNEWTEPILCKIKKYETAFSFNDRPGCKPYPQEDSTARKFVNSCVYDPLYLQRHSEREFIDALGKIRVEGIVKARLLDYVRTPFEAQRNVWQKVAFSYFKLNQCVCKKDIGLSEWQNALTRQLQNYEFDAKIDLATNSESFYRFTQIMTLEAIVELGSRQPEISLKLSELMKDYRGIFGKA